MRIDASEAAQPLTEIVCFVCIIALCNCFFNHNLSKMSVFSSNQLCFSTTPEHTFRHGIAPGGRSVGTYRFRAFVKNWLFHLRNGRDTKRDSATDGGIRSMRHGCRYTPTRTVINIFPIPLVKSNFEQVLKRYVPTDLPPGAMPCLNVCSGVVLNGNDLHIPLFSPERQQAEIPSLPVNRNEFRKFHLAAFIIHKKPFRDRLCNN